MEESSFRVLNTRGRMKLLGQDVPVLLSAGNLEDVSAFIQNLCSWAGPGHLRPALLGRAGLTPCGRSHSAVTAQFSLVKAWICHCDLGKMQNLPHTCESFHWRRGITEGVRLNPFLSFFHSVELIHTHSDAVLTSKAAILSFLLHLKWDKLFISSHGWDLSSPQTRIVTRPRVCLTPRSFWCVSSSSGHWGRRSKSQIVLIVSSATE